MRAEYPSCMPKPEKKRARLVKSFFYLHLPNLTQKSNNNDKNIAHSDTKTLSNLT